jgi:hypothetical protein
VTGPALLAVGSLAAGALLMRLLQPSPFFSLVLAAGAGGAASLLSLLSFFRGRGPGKPMPLAAGPLDAGSSDL